MFTGLVEEIGKINSISKGAKSAQISISAKKVLEHVQMGDSIAANGVCLTVTGYTSTQFTVDVMGETMRRSNLALLKVGDEVNLERALRVGDRLGGHIVSGHIDGKGTIINFTPEENAVWCRIHASLKILKYIIHKGSIAIDGVSLTVASVDDTQFEVSIIPHTKQVTTLLRKKPGDIVNLECDMIGKYVEKLVSFSNKKEKNKDISLEFLSKNGFM